MNKITVSAFKQYAVKELQTSTPSPQLDVEVFLSFCLSLTKTQLLLNRDQAIPKDKLDWLYNALEKRKSGLPVAYITGHKEFYGYDFIVSPAVLIPKPDTEILVERAIEIILQTIKTRPSSLLSVCDMCTGSGCIALSTLLTLIDTCNLPFEKLPVFTLVDISGAALKLARKNTDNLLQNRDPRIKSLVRFTQSNLFEQVPGTFNLILTNPPYIPHSMAESLLKDGRNEPLLALDGDVTLEGERAYTEDGTILDDGLTIIKNLILQFPQHLYPFGTVLMETGEYNAEAAAEFADNNHFKSHIHKDLEGQLRVVQMEKNRE